MDATSRCTVVVCDDQAGFRQLLSTVLALDPSVEVVGEAADGREAIAVVGALRPDVLILDVAMPVMDGIEALPHIREASPETHVVMLTGLAADSVRRRALAAGAAVFLEKGTAVDTIVGEITTICERV